MLNGDADDIAASHRSGYPNGHRQRIIRYGRTVDERQHDQNRMSVETGTNEQGDR